MMVENFKSMPDINIYIYIGHDKEGQIETIWTCRRKGMRSEFFKVHTNNKTLRLILPLLLLPS